MSRFEGVIFDWAGTTIDFGCFAPVRAFIETFKEFGVYPTIEEVRKPMGLSKIDHIRTILKMPRIQKNWMKEHDGIPGEAEAQAMNQVFESKLMEVLPLYTEPKPGVVKGVKKLRERGIKIGSTTGYTDEMMEIVVPLARKQGYEPDVWFSSDSTGKKGRPYPYMIFKNMEVLNLSNVRKVLKVGDTAADIREGKNAGVYSAAVVVGSSEMGLSEEEYTALSKAEQEQITKDTADEFVKSGADKIFYTMDDLIDYIVTTS